MRITSHILALCLALLSGCATSTHQAAGAVAADGISTAAALSQGAVELNPLGYATIPLRLAALAYADTLPKEEGIQIDHAITATGYGAAVNNILFAAGPIAALAGLMVGLGIWASGADEREFWQLCAVHRRLEPDKNLTCTWTKA